MEQLLTLLQKSADFLAAKGVEHPRANAEHLFAHGLGCKRLDLYLRFERPVTAEEQDTLRPLILRRSKREPLQYIVGDTDFYGLKLHCDPRALIPRPETEELVEHLVQRYHGQTPPATILDLGTGSGCLALALAKAFPQSQVTGVDASPQALELAHKNAKANNIPADTVQFLDSDWFTAITEAHYDLIVSNPPYLTPREWESAQPEVRLHEPRQALIGGGEDGGDDLRTIIDQAFAHLSPGGLLALETGIDQHPSLTTTAENKGYGPITALPDLQHRPRFFLAQRPA